MLNMVLMAHLPKDGLEFSKWMNSTHSESLCGSAHLQTEWLYLSYVSLASSGGKKCSLVVAIK